MKMTSKTTEHLVLLKCFKLFFTVIAYCLCLHVIYINIIIITLPVTGSAGNIQYIQYGQCNVLIRQRFICVSFFFMFFFTWIVIDGYWLSISFCSGLGEETILVQDSINRPSTRTIFFYTSYCCQYQNDLSCLLPESFKLVAVKLWGNGCWFLIGLKEGVSVFLIC